MKVHLSFLIAVIALVLGSAVEVKACSCVPERPVCESFGSASAVFVGKVVGAAEQKTEKNDDGTTTTYDVGAIHFVIEEAFSGVKGRKKVTIRSGTGGADCGYWFLRGERYLVYAYGDLKQGLGTSICSRTRLLNDADEDLSFLRQLPVEGSGIKIHGMVGKLGDNNDEKVGRSIEGLGGIIVTITNKLGKRIELVTDSSGSYEISSLKPGEYEVRAALPEHYYSDEYSVRKVKVIDRGCAIEDFLAIPNGQISGRIVDVEGNPVKKAKVVLIKTSTQGRFSMRDEIATDYVNDEKGRFELNQIAPGEYLLGVNLTLSAAADEPYPPTYYPGVSDRAQASIIKVGLGEKLVNYTLRLPPKLSERVIQGLVVWPDGSPAVGAQVHLTDQNHPGWIANGTVKTDAAGRFTLKGYEGISYWVLANIYSPKKMHAEPPLVSANGTVSGLRLVLSSEGSLCEHYYNEGEDK
ncbi:MAG TPA: hypothetical protein VF658_06825 [Pyrinomonadaceae bacterium]|jgi:hypothetical protein